MIGILHDFTYQSAMNYGSVVYMGSWPLPCSFGDFTTVEGESLTADLEKLDHQNRSFILPGLCGWRTLMFYLSGFF